MRDSRSLLYVQEIGHALLQGNCRSLGSCRDLGTVADGDDGAGRPRAAGISLDLETLAVDRVWQLLAKRIRERMELGCGMENISKLSHGAEAVD